MKLRVGKIFLGIIFLLFLFLAFLIPSKAMAAEVIRGFDVEIVAHRDGTMDVAETIAYDFGSENRHGIYRDISLVSRVGDLYRVIKVYFKKILRDGVEENFTQDFTNSKASIKIGESRKEITGLHTYQIYYSVENGIGSNYQDHDEIYWNITGNNWKVPILKASVKLTTDFSVSPDKAICFTGIQGSTLQDCDYSKIAFIETTNTLNPNEGLTTVWNFPKGTFPDSILQKNNPPEGSVLTMAFLGVPIFLNLVLAPGILIWYFKTKRKERFGPLTVDFDMPKDAKGKRVAPAEAGSIDIHRVDQNDIIATIFDLAIRKYLKIEQIKNKKTLGIFGGKEDYLFVKLKNADEKTESFEKELLERLFKDSNSIKTGSLKTDFYKTFEKMEKAIFAEHVKRGFYSKNPKTQMNLLLFLGILVIFIGGLILGPVLIYLSRKLNGRTSFGDKIDWEIDGLKIFLKNMSRNYTWQANNLYIVEKLIPYAIAFGFIKEFMEQLKIIYPNYHPTWYSGQTSFYSVTNSMFFSMGSSITTQAPSSSSGFSGGSSGGGGGGGGGGSW